MFLSLSSTIRITLIAHSQAMPKRQARRSPAYRLRQREREHRAFAWRAVDANRTAVELDKPAGQCKPESRTFLLARVLPTHLAELLEHRFVIGRGDADTGVLDGNLHGVTHDTRPHVDASTVGRELDGIGQQVQQDLLQLALVGYDALESGLDMNVESDRVLLRALANQRERVADRRRQVERREIELHPAR